MLYHYNNIFPNIPKEIQAKFLANHPPKMQAAQYFFIFYKNINMGPGVTHPKVSG